MKCAKATFKESPEHKWAKNPRRVLLQKNQWAKRATCPESLFPPVLICWSRYFPKSEQRGRKPCTRLNNDSRNPQNKRIRRISQRITHVLTRKLSCLPATNLTPTHQDSGIIPWWKTCRNDTWLYFLRNMKNTCKIYEKTWKIICSGLFFVMAKREGREICCTFYKTLRVMPPIETRALIRVKAARPSMRNKGWGGCLRQWRQWQQPGRGQGDSKKPHGPNNGRQISEAQLFSQFKCLSVQLTVSSISINLEK